MSVLESFLRILPLRAAARINSLVFTAERFSLPWVQALAQMQLPQDKISPEVLKAIQVSLFDLLDRDVENIRRGVYPATVLVPEPPATHLKRLPSLFWEGFWAARRKVNKNHSEFTSAEQALDGLPDYYKRNFHFQKDGYLSDRSAELYDHQVDVLFSGGAGAMRRLVILGLKQYFGNVDGAGLHFLDVAAGTGSAARDVLLAFPKAKLTLLDLSESYLKKARKRFANEPRVSFLQGDAAHLPFREAQFDSVYSVFLFHELPHPERIQVLKECRRVKKTTGPVLAVDSLQLDDNTALNEPLLQFPKDFHEPFYTDYIKKPLKDDFTSAGLHVSWQDQGFFSKALGGT